MKERAPAPRAKRHRYREIAETLLGGIESGKYQPGQKLPSEAVLVKRFETSRITVGRALRELKERGLIEGVAGSGNFVRAQASEAEELSFGLLIPNLGESEIFEPICQGMASAPESGSYALLWGHTSGSRTGLEARAVELCRQFISRKVAGVFFAPLEHTPNKDEVNARICALLDEADIPVVLLDRCIFPFPDRSKYDLVGIDNRRAGYIATEHLIKLGLRNIAFLALSDAAPTVEQRIAGYREALLTNGLPLVANHVCRIPSFSTAAVQKALDATGSSAFVCANDRIAGQLLQVLQQLGRKVPQDVKVVGIDDVEYASLLPVPLTTVHQPCRGIGEAAITAMLERRRKPEMTTRDILLRCHIVVRASA